MVRVGHRLGVTAGQHTPPGPIDLALDEGQPAEVTAAEEGMAFLDAQQVRRFLRHSLSPFHAGATTAHVASIRSPAGNLRYPDATQDPDRVTRVEGPRPSTDRGVP